MIGAHTDSPPGREFSGWFQCGFLRVATVQIYLSLMNPQRYLGCRSSPADVFISFLDKYGPSNVRSCPRKGPGSSREPPPAPKMCPSNNI